jgi:hypothetical protein
MRQSGSGVVVIAPATIRQLRRSLNVSISRRWRTRR